MDLATLSVVALVVAILVSCVTTINVGLLSMLFAWLIGAVVGDMRLEQVLAGFPSSLFVTLTAVTLLFGQAQVNGTLEWLTVRAVRLCRGSRGFIALMFFFVTLALSSMGPGNIASAALVAPLAMVAAGQVGIPALLMAIMVGNGASGGSLSPLAPAGIVANGIMSRSGMAGHEMYTFLTNVAAHTVVALGGFLLLGGWRLFARDDGSSPAAAPTGGRQASESLPISVRQKATVALIVAVMLLVVVFKVNIGMAALAGVIAMSALRLSDDAEAMRRVPWKVILMVTGVTVLIAVLEKNGGLDLFVGLLASLATKDSVAPVIAFLTGAASLYSSTSGVVLPALLPTVPGLAERLGGADALGIASSINVGGHLVDVSPLSTIGALCLAAAPATEDSRALFNKLLVWGMSMTVVGAALCWVMFG